MRKNRKVTAIAGTGAFLALIIATVLWGGASLARVIDFSSLIIVAVGGCMLALMKRPQGIDEFLRIFSKTSLLCGVIGFVLGLITILSNFTDSVKLGSELSVALISIFYGLFFSAVSYAMYNNQRK